MQRLVDEATSYAVIQLKHHSEAVIQAGIAIELQGRGAVVQREVPVPVPFQCSWSGGVVTVGSVRLDCVVFYDGCAVAIEVKRSASSAERCESQLQKYISTIDPEWGLVLASPDGTRWLRLPKSPNGDPSQ